MKPNQKTATIEARENGWEVSVFDGLREDYEPCLKFQSDRHVFTSFEEMADFLHTLFLKEREV